MNIPPIHSTFVTLLMLLLATFSGGGTASPTSYTALAGTPDSANGTGAAATFTYLKGAVTVGGNLYVVDYTTIRRIEIATGVVTTLAGTERTFGSTDGTGAAAQFNSPYGITTDGTNLYVADTGNFTIRRIVIATGVVTTLAGTANCAAGTVAAAQFRFPYGITTDGTNLYVADSSNYTIRQIVISTGGVTTLAGAADIYGTDGTGAAAGFDFPYGITTDNTNLYVTDSANYTIRQIVIATGVVTTLAGTADMHGSTDGTGAAARFGSLHGITTDGTNLYVVDRDNHTIRQIVIATGVVTTLAGTAGIPGSTDGTGKAARFDSPRGITTDNTNLYVMDTGNHTIRQIVIATGVVTTIAGTAGVSGPF